MVPILVLTLACLPQAAGQKPVKVTPMHVENRNTAQTLEDLWAAASIVIEGVIVAEEPTDLVRGGVVTPHTSFNVRVTEVFKPDKRVTQAGDLISVRRLGGDRDRGDHIERFVPDDFPQFRVGERYILFLRIHVLPNAVFYSTASLSAEAVFKLTGPAVESPGKRRISLELANRGPDGLRQLLRERRGRL